jgi:glutathione S-transferase
MQVNHIHPLRLQQPALQEIHTTVSPDGTLQYQQSLAPGLQSLDAISPDPNDGIFQRYLGAAPQAHAPHALHAPNPFEQHGAGLEPHSQSQFHALPPNGFQHPATTRFNLLAAPQPQQIQAPPPPRPQPPQQQLQQVPLPQPQVPQRIQQLEPQGPTVQDDDAPVTNHGQFEGLKLIPNPPDLEAWRDKLFHVDDTITLTEEE